MSHEHLIEPLLLIIAIEVVLIVGGYIVYRATGMPKP